MYKVSVVVVVYNTEKFIKECFDSIFSQTIDSYEVVVVDNASNEGTRIALENSLAGHENVVHRRMEENVGGATGATIGIGMASGEYLYIMDSDDILPPNALNALYTRAKQDDCDVVIGRSVSLINGKPTLMRTTTDEITWAKPLVTESLDNEPQLSVAPFFWGKIFRRSFIVDNGIYMKDGVINADRYMTTNALRQSKRTAVIRDLALLWRRSSIRNKKESITATSINPDLVVDRMQSLLDTAMLFDEGDLRQYVLASNLVRVFMVVRSLQTPEIKDVYVEYLNKYFELLDEEKLFKSLVVPVRHKVYEYLARRGRYDEIGDLFAVRKLKIKKRNGYTVETCPEIKNVPDEVIRRRTVVEWDKIKTSVKDRTVSVTCTVNDPSVAPAEAAGLHLSAGIELAEEDYCFCSSDYAVRDGKGIMGFSFDLDDDAIRALLNKKSPKRIFFCTISGDRAHYSETSLSASQLSALRKLLKDKTGCASVASISMKKTGRKMYEGLYNIVANVRKRIVNRKKK